jgi:hypothetical protein
VSPTRLLPESVVLVVLALLALAAGCASDDPPSDPGPSDDAGTAPVPDAAVSPDAEPPDAGPVPLPPLRDDALAPRPSWRDQVARSIDDWTLPAAFSAAGYALPAGTELMAVRVTEGPETPGYVFYEAGGGAFSDDFWPASTIKLLAALGALERVNEIGFTSGAHVTFDSGYASPLSDIVNRAIRVSDNYDYDRTVRIAGLTRLNDVFLTPERGFSTTAIQASYSGMGVTSSPGIRFVEGERSMHVPGYTDAPRGRCPGTGTNCTTLFELFEGARRILIDDEIPDSERFAIAAADVSLLRAALCAASPSFFASGVERALGPGAAICHKPGWVPSRDCLDHGMVVDPVTGDRTFILAATPALGRSDCPSLAPMAEHVLLALSDETAGMSLGSDEGAPIVVQLDVEPGSVDLFTIDAEGADRIVVHADGGYVGEATAGPRFTLEAHLETRGERIVSVESFSGPVPIGRRTLGLAF